jgi:hypothetical protein
VPHPPLEAFADDVSLDGDVSLLRRIPSLRFDQLDGDLQLDENGKPRVQGTAFQTQSKDTAARMGYPEHCMSLGLESQVMETPGGFELLQVDAKTNGVARVKASVFRTHGFGLQRVPEEGMPWHVVAFHPVSKSQAKNAQSPLAEACEVIAIPTCFQSE